MFFQLFDNLQGALLGGPGRELDLADDEALILIRQEGGRQSHEQEHHPCNHGAVNHQIAHRPAEGAPDDALILDPAEVEYLVEPAEELAEPATFARCMTLFNRL